MYPWVSHTHTHIGGACPHACAYCYVQRARFVPARYQGTPGIVAKEMEVHYGKGRTIFVEHCNDLFAEAHQDLTPAVLSHCAAWPDNRYVFQTKNPERLLHWLETRRDLFPPNRLFGLTLESNRPYPALSKAPEPLARIRAFSRIARDCNQPVFVSIEPILDLDVDIMISWLYGLQPQIEFVSVGADSKDCKLPEPDGRKVVELLAKLRENGFVVRVKDNLSRLAGVLAG